MWPKAANTKHRAAGAGRINDARAHTNTKTCICLSPHMHTNISEGGICGEVVCCLAHTSDRRTRSLWEMAACEMMRWAWKIRREMQPQSETLFSLFRLHSLCDYFTVRGAFIHHMHRWLPCSWSLIWSRVCKVRLHLAERDPNVQRL